MTETTNYKLKKPQANENYNIEDFNYNADIIDTQLKAGADAQTATDDAANVLSQTVASQSTQISALDAAKADTAHTHTAASVRAVVRRDSMIEAELNDSTCPVPYIADTIHGKTVGLPHDWIHVIGLHHTNALSGYGAQIAIPFGANNIYVRQAVGKVWSSWRGFMGTDGGTMTGWITAQPNTLYTARQVRNIVQHTDTSVLTDVGDVYHVYE